MIRNPLVVREEGYSAIKFHRKASEAVKCASADVLEYFNCFKLEVTSRIKLE